MPAKIVVTSVKGGSHISLLGSSGKELLSSVVFKEPRAKGATLRALKGLLGETIVEDHTIKGPQRKVPATPAAAAKALATAAVEKVEEVVSPAPKRKSASKKATPKARAAKAAPAPESVPEAATTKVAAARKTTKRATARP